MKFIKLKILDILDSILHKVERRRYEKRIKSMGEEFFTIENK